MKKPFAFLRHHRLQRALALYIDGELPHNESEEMRQHLESCAACGQKLADICACRELIKAGRTPQVIPTAKLWQSIVKATAVSVPGRVSLGRFFFTTNSSVLRWSVAGVLLVLLGLALWKKNPSSERSIATRAAAVIDYGIFLDDLRHDASEAKFHKRYPAQIVKLAEAQQAIAFPLAAISALPDSFQLDCVRVLECSGQKCVQFTCSKAGKAINIFQHALGQPWTMGQYAVTRTPICNVECAMVDAKEVMALSWQGKNSEFLAIGALTPQEFAQVVQVLQ
ncbi:zf-HC2 domain-containing protein [candidate division KSB1 bacterium]|nr:zf-HC2 domain-containing protein [candidate division KSB1 bacterium]